MTSITVNSGAVRTTGIGVSTKTPWTKPDDWPELPTITSSDNKIAGLYAVWPNQENFIALTVSSNGGASGCTIDWGDGVIETPAAGTIYHTYDYNDPDLSPVTSRGYKIATVIITPASGSFYTLNITAKHNQSFLPNFYTTGWLDLSVSGTGFATTNLTLGSTNPVQHRMLERVRLYNIGAYAGGGLFSGNVALKTVTMPSTTSSLTSTSSMFTSCHALQSVNLFDTSNVTSMSSMFNNCYSLQSVPNFNTSKVTNMANMFTNCHSLQTIPEFNTANVTTMVATFSGCKSIRSVPKFNTSRVTDMSNMFSECVLISSVPQFDTANVTNMYRMFHGTYQGNSLMTVPLFDTSKVTNMEGMFYNNFALTSVPPFNTANVANMSSMFSMFYGTNGALETIPSFNTANVITFNSMFRNCGGLQSVPALNTSRATDMADMFRSCYTLETIPQLSTSNVRTMANMFDSCYALQTIPTMNTSRCQVFGSMFNQCNSLTSIPAMNVSNTTVTGNYSSMFTNSYSLANVAATDFRYSFSVINCRLSNTALNYMFTNLATVPSAQTVIITSNYGANTCNTTIATSKGWTVTN